MTRYAVKMPMGTLPNVPIRHTPAMNAPNNAIVIIA
jgi:hypothetical protein